MPGNKMPSRKYVQCFRANILHDYGRLVVDECTRQDGIRNEIIGINPILEKTTVRVFFSVLDICG
jgi:hypothetical protein